MGLRESIFATAAFFSSRGARIDKVLYPWGNCYVFQLYLPGQGKRWLVCSLESGSFTALVSEEPFPAGDGGRGKHWRSLKMLLKGSGITGASAAEGGRGLELHLRGGRASRLVLHAGQMSLLDLKDKSLWSHRPGRPEAVLRSIAGDNAGDMLDSLKLAALLFEAARRRHVQELRRQKKRAARALEKVLADKARFAQADELQQEAELLKSQLYLVQKGASEVALQNYFSPDGGEVRIKLEPSLSPQENMQRLFKRSLKYRRGQELVLQREAELRQAVSSLEEATAEIQTLEFEEREKLFRDLPVREKKRDQTSSQLPYYTFPGDGWTIYVGKNDRGNEAVTFKLGRGNDIWVHARNYPGSHVVVKPHKKGDVPGEDVLQKAAKLALFYSSAGKAGGREEVVLIEVKHVKKIPGARPGQVTYGKGRTVMVTLESGFRPGSLFRESPGT